MPTYRNDEDGYYLAPSLVALMDEVDDRWPARGTRSDGWIGDASHAARKSDHNPDYDAGGVVRAVDITRQGIDVEQLLEAVVGDLRAWYVIHNRRIASATYGWKWRPYAGSNPHTEHVHISIKHNRTAETSTARWFTRDSEDDMPYTEAELRAMMQAENEEYATRFWVAPSGTGTALIKRIDALGSAVAALGQRMTAEDAADDAALKSAVAGLKAEISKAIPQPPRSA